MLRKWKLIDSKKDKLLCLCHFRLVIFLVDIARWTCFRSEWFWTVWFIWCVYEASVSATTSRPPWDEASESSLLTSSTASFVAGRFSTPSAVLTSALRIRPSVPIIVWCMNPLFHWFLARPWSHIITRSPTLSGATSLWCLVRLVSSGRYSFNHLVQNWFLSCWQMRHCFRMHISLV